MELNRNFQPKGDFNKDWITKKVDKKGIDYLENLGFYLCDKRSKQDNWPGRDAVSTSQLRNIFAEVKRIELLLDNPNKTWEEQETNVLLLRPKIAYNAARVLSKSKYSRMKVLREVLENALILVEGKEDFKRFSNMVEGIIAYHKVYGGKD